MIGSNCESSKSLKQEESFPIIERKKKQKKKERDTEEEKEREKKKKIILESHKENEEKGH